MNGQRNTLLVTGKKYRNRGGGTFYCTEAWKLGFESHARLINMASGWCLLAHGIILYEDGSIEWDYSTGGRFVEIPEGGTEE